VRWARTLGESYFGYVDGDQERLRYSLVVALVGVDATLGGEEDAVYVAIVGGVIEAGGAAEDVDGVVVTAEQAVGTEAGDLFAGVALDAIGEGDLEAAPGFACDLDGGNFFGGESLLGVEERSVEVGPEGFADEVGDVNFVPGGFALLSCEGLLGVVAGIEQGSVGGFDNDAVGLKDGALVLAWEVDREALVACFGGEDDILEKVSLAFDPPDAAGNGCGDLDGVQLVPAVKTAVCFEG